jgi:uncharacterized protein YidB (DUF937 family)
MDLSSLTGAGGNQQQGIMQALVEHLTSSGGLQGVVNNFRGSGLGNKVDSWVGTGENESISGEEVERGLGNDTVNQIASRAGISPGVASPLIAAVLPMVVDRLTPNGQMPDQNSFMSIAQGLLTRLKKST